MTPETYAFIRDHARKYPDQALAAVFDGYQQALNDLRGQRPDKDSAMLAAITLIEAKRVTPELKVSLNKVICRGINPEGCSIPEQAILDRGKP